MKYGPEATHEFNQTVKVTNLCHEPTNANKLILYTDDVIA